MPRIGVLITEDGVPQTGLSPTIDIIRADTGATVQTGQALTELSLGFYEYDFSAANGYDEDLPFLWRVDATATVQDADRYYWGSNTVPIADDDDGSVVLSGSGLDASASFAIQGAVWVDTVNGSGGGAGTPLDPVDDINTAVTIAAANNLTRIMATGSDTLTAAMAGYDVQAYGYLGFTLALGGFSVTGSSFRGCFLSGATAAFDTLNCIDSHINAISAFFLLRAERCIFGAVTIAPGAGGTIQATNCSVEFGGSVTFDFTATGLGFLGSAIAGDYVFTNMAAGETADVGLHHGTVTLAASCTTGSATVEGVGSVTDSSGGGFTVTDNTVVPAVFARVMETGFSFDRMVRIIAAAVAGKSSGGDTAPVFRNLADTIDQITGTAASTGRTSAAYGA